MKKKNLTPTLDKTKHRKGQRDTALTGTLL